MGHTPYGYKIENGKAVIDETAAGKLRTLFDNYLNGLSLQTAAKAAGIKTYHYYKINQPICKKYA